MDLRATALRAVALPTTRVSSGKSIVAPGESATTPGDFLGGACDIRGEYEYEWQCKAKCMYA